MKELPQMQEKNKENSLKTQEHILTH